MAHDILIVDDERDICTLIAGILEDEGYTPAAPTTAPRRSTPCASAGRRW